MPDCVQGVPGELKPVSLEPFRYDLIILGYQPWFLSPSIPTNTLLHDPGFIAALKDTPVITVTGCRNMWISAHARLRQGLEEKGAKVVGNIALVDRHPNLVSLVTILHWMFKGKKERYLNIFPIPGVSAEDIQLMNEVGRQILPFLESGDYTGMQKTIVDAGAASFKYHLMIIELNGSRIFGIWAKVIVGKKNRTPWLRAFKYYILVALLILGPLVFLITNLIIRPLSGGHYPKRRTIIYTYKTNRTMSLRPVYITRTSMFLPNDPVSSEDMESYLGYINGKPSKARKIVLRNNGIETRYYALNKDGQMTHTNADLSAEAVKALFVNDPAGFKSVDLLTSGTSSRIR